MEIDPNFKPRLRPVEPFRMTGDNGQIGIRDPSGISDVILALSPAAFHLMTLMDGTNSIEQIRAAFASQFGQGVKEQTLAEMVENLDAALFLEGPVFEARYAHLQSEYRGRGVRVMSRAEELGVTGDGVIFREMLGEHESPNGTGGTIRGIVAPHLDYPRGAPCYGPAYASLRGRTPPQRVIILGTNHAGRSAGVVSTGCDFETPLGVTRCDREFLEAIEARCGTLRAYELDHAKEHSVELQVAWLQFLFGAKNFSIVPFLCPDPCGPNGRNGNGEHTVSLQDFATALREQIEIDSTDALVVAGADLSHVGASFGDERDIDDAFLEEVRKADRRALDYLELGDSEGFVECIAKNANPTRICSAGCMFALARALPRARAQVVRYHQAVDRESGVCVTCAAVVFA